MYYLKHIKVLNFYCLIGLIGHDFIEADHGLSKDLFGRMVVARLKSCKICLSKYWIQSYINMKVTKKCVILENMKTLGSQWTFIDRQKVTRQYQTTVHISFKRSQDQGRRQHIAIKYDILGTPCSLGLVTKFLIKFLM